MIRPNILVIFTDQQSATMMSCAENRYFQTPAMDSLAERGTRFERAYCSFPVCIASRFSFMTGRMPSTIDVTVANKLHSISDNNIETVPPGGYRPFAWTCDASRRLRNLLCRQAPFPEDDSRRLRIHSFNEGSA